MRFPLLEMLGILPGDLRDLSVNLPGNQQPVSEPDASQRCNGHGNGNYLVFTSMPPSSPFYGNLTPCSYGLYLLFRGCLWLIAKTASATLRTVYALSLSFALACTVFALAIEGSFLLPAVFADPVGAGFRLTNPSKINDRSFSVRVSNPIDNVFLLGSPAVSAFEVPAKLPWASTGVAAPLVLDVEDLFAHGVGQ